MNIPFYHRKMISSPEVNKGDSNGTDKALLGKGQGHAECYWNRESDLNRNPIELGWPIT
jgi:hypothetical protein